MNLYLDRSITVQQYWLHAIHVQQPEIETWRELDVAQPPVPRFERTLVNHFVDSSHMRVAVGDLHISLDQYISAKYHQGFGVESLGTQAQHSHD